MRCLCCDILFEKGSYQSNPDLCSKCSEIVQKTISDKTTFIPKDPIHKNVKDGITSVKCSNY